MGLVSFEEYQGHYKENNGIPFVVNGTAGSAGRTGSTFKIGSPVVNTTPTLATALYASSLGQSNNFPLPFQTDNAPSAYYVMAARINPASVLAGSYTLCDRLSHQGNLNATATTAQTTNLPTAALPRYTDGVGVMMALEIYTQIGATTTSFTVSYTNSDGTSGRTSPPMTIGNTGYREANRFIQIPLASGDKGVRSVESITLAGTTGTAGAMGITLYKPLAMFNINNSDGPNIMDPIGGGHVGSLVGVDPNAYLFFVTIGNVATAACSGFIFICDGNT